MLNTINIALTPWIVASLVVSESGMQSLTLRTAQFGSDGPLMELDRLALAQLTALLTQARLQYEKGLILDCELWMVGATADELRDKSSKQFQLPF